MKEQKAQFIADLYELKMTMVRPFSQDYKYIEPNITYSILETLIATFMNKYELKYEDIIKVLNERRLNNPPLTN